MIFEGMQKTSFYKIIGIVIISILASSAHAYAQNDEAALADVYDNKTLDEMKAGVGSTTASKLKKSVALQEGPQKLVSALESIARQAGLRLSYSKQFIPLDKKVVVKETQTTAERALWNVLEDTPFRFGISASGQLVLLKMQQPESNEDLQEMVTGSVTDAQSGETLPGVNVLVKGTTTGASTDNEGSFELNVESLQDTLVFSFVGYQTQEVPINGRTEINVVLQSQAIAGEELVVVGYGTERESTMAGSVTRTDDTVLQNSPSVSVSNSLSGLLPGLTALNRSGQPGENTSEILIRGQSTLGDNNPLVVVDGVPDETGAWQRIPQSDIEQISVLKDASAAIYGARAANGVILITTKRGSLGKPTFNYSFNQGIVQPTRLPEVANSWEWAEYVNMYRENYQNLPPRYTEEEIKIMREGSDPINYPNTDWPGLIFKDYALQGKHNLSVRGGSEEIRYSVSGSYSGENSMVKDGLHDYDGYTLRANVDADVTENISFGLDINGGIHDMIEPEIGGFGYTTSPLIVPFYPNGLPNSVPSDANTNPALNLTGVGGYESDKILRGSVKGSFDINIPQIEGLGTDGYFSFKNERTEGRVWRETWKVYNYDAENDEYNENPGGEVENPDLREQYERDQSYLINLRLIYETQIGDDHSLESFLAVEQSESTYKTFEAYRRDFISPAIEELFAGAAENMEADGTRRESARQNIFGRINYEFQEKYLVDVNMRYDGSHAFPPGNRWGFFPGVSVAWRIGEENFLSSNESVNELKLRASYAQMGNDRIDPFQFRALNTLIPTGTHFGGGTQAVVEPGVSPNPNITWEVATNQNIGLDARFWDGLFGFSVDLFKQERENILTSRGTEVPIYTGLVLPDENIGVTQNQGIEIELEHENNSLSSDLSYSITGNIAYAKSEILDISEPQDIPEHQRREGNPIGAQLLYQAEGIFRSQQEVDSNPIMPGTRVGDLQYKDINGDGVINSADRTRMDKGPIPEITYGFNTNIGYKNFTLFANFAGQTRAWTYIFQNCRTTMNCMRDIVLNAYTPGSMDSEYPIMSQESEPGEGVISAMPSTFWLENASFLRLKTLQLGYALPNDIISRIGLTSARVYINGNNLFTVTPMKWFDPEGDPGSEGGSVAGEQVQYSTGSFYPQTRIFNLGVNISF